MNERIRKATANDVTKVVHHLVRAFKDDPLVDWMVMEYARIPQAPDLFFRTCLETLCMPHDEALVVDDCSGAALWYPPGKHKIGIFRQLSLLPIMLKAGGFKGMKRIVQSIDRVDRVHPREKHYYLHFVGVDPDLCGRGLGKSLIQPMLDRCDQEDCGAYLENTKQANEGFYKNLGFSLKGELIIKAGAPPIWPMWRDPK